MLLHLYCACVLPDISRHTIQLCLCYCSTPDNTCGYNPWSKLESILAYRKIGGAECLEQLWLHNMPILLALHIVFSSGNEATNPLTPNH